MPKLPVKGLPEGDNGRLLVRLNRQHREGIDRYGLAKITNNANQKSMIILVLGHDDEDAIFMPYDIRTGLAVSRAERLDFSIAKIGMPGKVLWYVNSPDPAVYIPAWIAVVGTILAVLGLVIGVIPLIS